MNDTVLPPIPIQRPVPITFDGYIKYTDGSGASGVTVTMKRTKHDLGQTTTETTGEMSGMDYSDATPDVTFTYDRGGRQRGVTDAAGAHTRTFNARGELQTEQIAGGLLDGVIVSTG